MQLAQEHSLPVWGILQTSDVPQEPSSEAAVEPSSDDYDCGEGLDRLTEEEVDELMESVRQPPDAVLDALTTGEDGFLRKADGSLFIRGEDI